MSEGPSVSCFPPGWYPLVHLSEVPSGPPIAIERFGRALVVWRTSSGVHAADDRCPHRSAQLSLGHVVDDQLVCPFHAFAFTADGRCAHMPDVGKAAPGLRCRMHRVEAAHGYAWVWWGDNDPADSIPWLDWLPSGARRTLVTETWDVPFDLAIENQIDHTHLSVVHRDTIGRGISIEAPVTFTFDDDGMRAAFDDNEGFADYRWPGLWGTRVSDTLSLTIATTPVSSRRTKLYLEGHRGFATNAVLGPLVDLGIRRFHKKVLSQDRPIVLSQARWDAEEDRLFTNDRAIRWFRNKLVDQGYRRPLP